VSTVVLAVQSTVQTSECLTIGPYLYTVVERSAFLSNLDYFALTLKLFVILSSEAREFSMIGVIGLGTYFMILLDATAGDLAIFLLIIDLRLSKVIVCLKEIYLHLYTNFILYNN
jgi:hypothetical protein